MEIKILAEDTSVDSKLISEHGFSAYIKTQKHNILLDTGASSNTWLNAKMLGVAIDSIDTVVLSHGHYDHSGGIMSFYANGGSATLYLRANAGEAYMHGDRYIGIDRKILELPQARLVEEELRIDEELSLFSGIRGRRLWPESNLVLSRKEANRLVQDDFSHEQCLVVNEGNKVLLITGCAHNGILNILDRYYELYSKTPDAVVSGFHMCKKGEYSESEIANIESTAEELLKTNITFYSGHCTGTKAFDILKKVMGEKMIALFPGVEIVI